MDIKVLQRLIESGEGQHLEFKKKADHPEKIAREMVAFANSGGGILLLGVEDNGRISGLSYPEEEQYVMESALFHYVKPEIIPELEKIAAGSGKYVLKYRVPDGPQKPYYWLEDREKGRFAVYVRSGEQSLRASYEMYRILKDKKQNRAIVIGENESRLFSVLGNGRKITIADFMEYSGYSRKKVSAMFISLALKGMLKIEPGKDRDFYSLSENYLEDTN